jgi:hypothetical protein
MKVIFLDIDGVISTFEKQWKLDINKLDLLTNIINETNAKIVISSSWRIGCTNADDMKQRLLTHRIDDNIKYSEEFKTFLESIIDITPNGSQNGPLRGNEIQDWIDEHNDIETYVIIDDDSDMLDKQLFNFVQTDGFEGITEREVKLCISILNGKKVINPIRLNFILRNEWMNNCNGLEHTNIMNKIKNYNLLKK